MRDPPLAFIGRRVSDTIFALSSGALPAAIAVIRISGPSAMQAAEALAGPLPAPRQLVLRDLRDAEGLLVDRALLAVLPAPRTVTGEPLVELHCHGGRAVISRLLALLGAMPGLREAEPGEFTRRALLNGRLDLTEAEGLADLLSAETEWQRRAATDVAGGALRQQVDAWRDRLVLLSAEAEAAIDYVDEEETELDLGDLVARARELASEWRSWLDEPRAELLHHGLRVVLAGPPNAGKSSLFNALVGQDKAIVTPVPGTTRDTIEAHLTLEGIRLTLVDTAGFRDSDDEVERIGIERARTATQHADITLWLGPPREAPANNAMILVHPQSDLRTPASNASASIATSVITGEGLASLRAAIVSAATSLLPPQDKVTLNRRQAASLQEAAEALDETGREDVLLLAEALRQALHALDRLSGRQGTEEVLDALFGRFCLGK